MPQLTEKEQIKCRILVGKGHTPGEITEKLGDARAKRTPPVPPPDVTSVRRYLRGVTHRVGMKETRGRKRTFNVSRCSGVCALCPGLRLCPVSRCSGVCAPCPGLRLVAHPARHPAAAL